MAFIRSTIAVDLLSLSTGIHYGWAASAMPKLISVDSPINMTTDDAAWIVSLPELGDIGGAIASAIVGNRVGRKTIFLVAPIPIVIGWLTVLFAKTVTEICLGRIITGMGVILGFSVTPPYFSEIAPVKHRGAVTVSQIVSVSAGILIAYVVGYLLPVRPMAIFAIVLQVVCVIFIFCIPESPYYCLLVGDHRGARDSLVRLRGTNNVDDELTSMTLMIQRDTSSHGLSYLDLFRKPLNRKALFIVTGSAVTIRFTGTQVFFSYSNAVFESINTGIKSGYLTMIMGFVHMIGVTSAIVLVDRLGRKTILLTCLTVGLLCNLFLSLFYLMGDSGYDKKPYSGPAVCLVLIYTLVDGMGLSTLLYTLTSELFSVHVKSIATVYLLCLDDLCNLILLKYFIAASIVYGMSVVYAVFSTFSAIAIVFILVFLPETKRKTYDEIQMVLAGTRSNNPVCA